MNRRLSAGLPPCLMLLCLSACASSATQDRLTSERPPLKDQEPYKSPSFKGKSFDIGGGPVLQCYDEVTVDMRSATCTPETTKFFYRYENQDEDFWVKLRAENNVLGVYRLVLDPGQVVDGIIFKIEGRDGKGKLYMFFCRPG